MACALYWMMAVEVSGQYETGGSRAISKGVLYGVLNGRVRGSCRCLFGYVHRHRRDID
jgi:hypothetical protein